MKANWNLACVLLAYSVKQRFYTLKDCPTNLY